MSKEKRMAGSYEIEQSIYIGEKEVLFGVNKAEEYPFMVCYCSYNNPLSAPWCTEAIGTDDYLEAMQVFTDRVQAQIELVKTEQEQYRFDKTPFTVSDCIPDNHSSNIVGKVVVINAEPKRYEYQHAAYQLVLADGGHGATGGRGQAVFGTCLEGAIIVLACIIFSLFAAAPPVVNPDAAAVTMVWSYVGELIFNMLILVGAVKMADRVVREMMGL